MNEKDREIQENFREAFDCLVAHIVNEYDESDLLRYFFPKEYSTEDKPTLESSSWRIVYWAKLLIYWLGSKLFNRQKFKMNQDQAELHSAIIAIKKVLKTTSYCDACKSSSFKRNLEIVASKFVGKPENNISNIIKEINLPPTPTPPASASASNFSPSPIPASTSHAPPPPPPPPIPTSTSHAAPPHSAGVLPPVVTSKQANDTGNDRNALLAAIRKGMKLKPVSAGDTQRNLPENEEKFDPSNLAAILEHALKKKFKNVNGSGDEDENKSEIGDDEFDGRPNIYFAEFDSQNQIDAMMNNLESEISQDFVFNSKSKSDVIDKVRAAFTQVNAKKENINNKSLFFLANEKSDEGEKNAFKQSQCRL